MSKQNLKEKKFINELLQDKHIKEFIDEHQITEKEFDIYLETFMAFYLKKQACKNCLGINECKQTRKGLIPVLDKEGSYITLDYIECSYQEEIISKQNEHLHLYNTSFVNVDNDMFVNEERKEVLSFYKKFLQSYFDNPHQKGLYLYGSYGCGKSYIMGNLANELAKQGVDTAFVYL